MTSLTNEGLKAFEQRIELAGQDLSRLSAIDAELAKRPELEARKLRFRIASIKRKASGKSVELGMSGLVRSQSLPTRPAPAGPWRTLLDRWNLKFPDGRPLHGYKIDQETSNDLLAVIRKRAPRGLSDASAETAALFVLWASHWFQHQYRGGVRRWEDLGAALELPFTGADGRRLTREGLQTWRRPAVRSESTHQWLVTLAVEGGFPAGILDETDGWAGRYLSRIVGTLLSQGVLDPDTALACAQSYAAYVPRVYRQDIFFALAADLATAVVRLRREVDATERARGMPASAWLDATRPGWRDDLPIQTGSSAAASLVDGLMGVEAFAFGASTVGCERLLLRHGAIWRPAVRLGLDGIASGTLGTLLRGRQERLRAYPAGAFSRYSASELALFEPPTDVQDGWRVRPSRTVPIIPGVPLTDPICVELRFEGRAVLHVDWPDGEAVRSEFGVFAGATDPDDGTLTLIGTGSGAYKPDTIYIVTPPTWAPAPQGGGSTVRRLEAGVDDGRQLWKVEGTAIVQGADGEVYRVTSGQAGAQRERIVLLGQRPVGLVSEEPTVELFAGFPHVQVFERQQIRDARRDELYWRHDGERRWNTFQHPPQLGRIEIAWREPETQYLRDRCRVFVVPSGTMLNQRRDAGAVIFQPAGLAPHTIRSADPELVLERRGETLAARFLERPSRRARFNLVVGNGRGLDVSAPFPLGSGLARWSGTRIRGSGASAVAPKLTLAELADCVAFSEGRQVLFARVSDRQHRALPGGAARWSFQDELPLRGVAEDLSALLLPFGDIDVWAELSFLHGLEFWHISQFEANLVVQSGDLQHVEDLTTDETLPFCGRAIANPAHEVELAHSTFADRLNRRAPTFSPDVTGTWLIYLRRDNAIVSRPAIVRFPSNDAEPRSGIRAAVRIADASAREAALKQALYDIGAGAPETEIDVQWLTELGASLRGLPPASLDPLRLMASSPAAAARVALHASDSERGAVLALSEGLPFSWFLVPVSTWERVAQIEAECLRRKLEDALGEAAGDLAIRAIKSAAAKLCVIEPLLQWPLFAAGLIFPHQVCERRALTEAAQDHIRRYGDRADEYGSCESMFRELISDGLPREFERFDVVHLEELDAPCAAAYAAVHGTALNAAAIRRIKTAARADPIYFGEAFNACLVTLLNT